MSAIADPPAKIGSAVPSSTGEIHVGADGGFGGAPASTPIKPAVSPKPSVPAPKTPTPSAREAMDAALTKRIKPGTGTDTHPEKPMGEVPAEKADTEKADPEESPDQSESAEAPKTPKEARAQRSGPKNRTGGA